MSLRSDDIADVRCDHSVSQVGDREWRCWKCGADQTVMEAEEPDEEHGPWSYTEYGVLCACGLGMRNERCREDWTDLLPEVRQVLETARAACKAARWPEQHRDDCEWCAYCAGWQR